MRALALALLLAGCAPSIRPEYEAEAARASEVLRGVPDGWAPDVRVQLSTVALQDAVSEAMGVVVAAVPPVSVGLPFGASAGLAPSLRLTGMVVTPSEACVGCLSYAASASGPVRASAAGFQLSLPVTAAVMGTAELEVLEDRRVVLRPRSIDRVRVAVEGLPAVMQDPSGALQEALRRAAGGRLPAVELYDLADTELPVRAVGVGVLPGGVEVRLLTDVPDPVPVAPGAFPEAGARVRLSRSVMTGLARRKAFAEGPVALAMVPEPRAIALDGDRFVMDLRLWRLSGRGWWRDYEVRGRVAVEGERLAVGADSAREVGHSPGAGLVDPLAAAFRPVLAQAVESAVRMAVPAKHEETEAGVAYTARLRAVSGVDNAVLVDLDIDATSVSAAPPRDGKPGFGLGAPRAR